RFPQTDARVSPEPRAKKTASKTSAEREAACQSHRKAMLNSDVICYSTVAALFGASAIRTSKNRWQTTLRACTDRIKASRANSSSPSLTSSRWKLIWVRWASS
ncbi:MAG: hypothetical protein WAM05_15140, partial [Candidatus Binataceae bacterium]